MLYFMKRLHRAFKEALSEQEKEGETFIDSQRRNVFYYSSMVVFACIPVYILMTSSSSIVFTVMNTLLLLAMIALVTAFSTHQWSLKKAFSGMLIAVQLESSLEIVVCSFYALQYPRLVIMTNMLLSLIFIMIAICAYMGKLVNWLTAIPLVGYLIGAVSIEGALLLKYLLMMVMVLLLANILGRIVYRNALRVMRENDILKKEEQKIMKYLCLSREELFALVELMSQENSHEETKDLIEAIGPQAKENLFKALHTHQHNERTELERIREVFPELTASEQTICQLILKDKTINQICEILYKSPGNITSQRAHIRAKLGLRKEENLKQVLQKRLQEHYGVSL